MRINRFVAAASGLSRRKADILIANGQVMINGTRANTGDQADADSLVTLKGKPLTLPRSTTVMLNKPPGYVVSRDGQGSPTVYELLPAEYQKLKPIGRLDKQSSGLLLLTNEGELANRLTHPSYSHSKLYNLQLNRSLNQVDAAKIENEGVNLEDGISRFAIKPSDTAGLNWQVKLSEGRNRQIRRTFAKLGYTVVILHRIEMGKYRLGDLPEGKFKALD